MEQSAGNRAMHTPELLEQVLLHLTTRQLFGVQRVCHTFQVMITSSVKIQQKMFLLQEWAKQGDSDPTDLPFDDIPWINPLLQMHTGCLDVLPRLPAYEHFSLRFQRWNGIGYRDITGIEFVASFAVNDNARCLRSLGKAPFHQSWEDTRVTAWPMTIKVTIESMDLNDLCAKEIGWRTFGKHTIMRELGDFLEGWARRLGARTMDGRNGYWQSRGRVCC